MSNYPIKNTYSLYLSTSSTINPPQLHSNGLYSWSINWREIFDDLIDYNDCCICNLRTKIVTNTAVANGSVRASFSSARAKITNGFNLGSLESNGTISVLDQLNTRGGTIELPTNNTLQIQLLDATEKLITTSLQFQVWFYFDVVEHVINMD